MWFLHTWISNERCRFIEKNSSPSEDEIREWFEGHICRCTGYKNIIKAVQEAIKQ